MTCTRSPGLKDTRQKRRCKKKSARGRWRRCGGEVGRSVDVSGERTWLGCERWTMTEKSSWAQAKKDNFIRLSQIRVCSYAAGRRSTCKQVCVSLLARQKGPRGKQPCDAWSSDEGGTWSAPNLVCMLMTLALQENFLWMRSTSPPQQNKYNTLHIAFLHIVSPEFHLVWLIILKIYAGDSHSLEGSMLFIDFFFFSASMTRLIPLVILLDVSFSIFF